MRQLRTFGSVGASGGQPPEATRSGIRSTSVLSAELLWRAD
jgi:hypothetical protein